jgi:sporulation protein YlmC with PRC-barrel domain
VVYRTDEGGLVAYPFHRSNRKSVRARINREIHQETDMNNQDRNTPERPEVSGDTAPAPRLMRADTLIGENVYNLEGIELGEIKDIMLDVNAGSIAYAVLSFGGFFGIADKLFAVPWKALKPDDVYKRFILDVDKESLESAPGFDKDHWPDMADPMWQNKVHSYYGAKPYKETVDTPDTPYDETPYTKPSSERTERTEKETPTSKLDTGRIR